MKSKSQRLRAVLFLLYQKEPRGFATFDEYYDDLMERIINFYKEKL